MALVLTKAWDNADTEIATFKANLRTKRKQHKADLANDWVVGHANRHKSMHPNPITTTPLGWSYS